MTTIEKAMAAVHRAWANARAIPHDDLTADCRCIPCNNERDLREREAIDRREHLAWRNRNERAR